MKGRLTHTERKKESKKVRKQESRKEGRGGYLEALGSVDGSERPEHSQHPEDLHHRDGAGPGHHRAKGLQ